MTFPLDYYHDEDSDGAAFLLLLRPIRLEDAFVNFAGFIGAPYVRGSAFDDNDFAHVGINRSAGVADLFWKRLSDRIMFLLPWGGFSNGAPKVYR